MKKVLMFLCLVFALFGCEKVEEMKEVLSTIVPVNFDSMSSCLCGYRINDPSGFGRHPLIDKLSDSTQVMIKEGLTLVYNPNYYSFSSGVRILSYKSLAEEAGLLKQEIDHYGSTIVPFYKEDNNFDWLSGVKNGKGWIGKADSKTRKVINEWTDGKEVEQDIKVDLGYGDYKTIHMDRLAIQSVVNIENDYIVATTRYNNDNYNDPEGSVWYNLYVLSDNRIVAIPLIHTSLRISGCEVIPWYKNSFLVSQVLQTSCYSLDGKLINTFKNTPSNSIRSSGEIFPCSYSDCISFFRYDGSIARTTLIKESSNNVWSSYYEALSKIPSDSQVTYTLLSSSTDIWEFKADVLNYDGSKKSLKFKVNIETGEVTD